MEEIFIIRSSEVFGNCIKYITVEHTTRELEVIIRDNKEKRSQAQRRLQHMWYTFLYKQWGWTHKEVRDHYMATYAVPMFYRDDINGSANTIDVIRDLKAQGMRAHYLEMKKHFVESITTNSFNVAQNKEYLDAIYHDCASNNIQLPIPEDLGHAYQA